MAGKKGHGGAGYAAVKFIEHAGQRLLGKDVLGAIRARAIHHIRPKTASPGSYAKGGRVKRTGKAKVHKGEVVLPKKTVTSLKKLMK